MDLLIVRKRRREEAYDKSWYKKVKGIKTNSNHPVFMYLPVLRLLGLLLQIFVAFPDLLSTIFSLFWVPGGWLLGQLHSAPGLGWLMQSEAAVVDQWTGEDRCWSVYFLPYSPGLSQWKGLGSGWSPPGFLQTLSFMSLASLRWFLFQDTVCTAFQEQHSSSPSA